MARKETQIVCKSVFKNDAMLTKGQFTQKWIEIINQLEKGKKISIPKA